MRLAEFGGSGAARGNREARQGDEAEFPNSLATRPSFASDVDDVAIWAEPSECYDRGRRNCSAATCCGENPNVPRRGPRARKKPAGPKCAMAGRFIETMGDSAAKASARDKLAARVASGYLCGPGAPLGRPSVVYGVAIATEDRAGVVPLVGFVVPLGSSFLSGAAPES